MLQRFFLTLTLTGLTLWLTGEPVMAFIMLLAIGFYSIMETVNTY